MIHTSQVSFSAGLGRVVCVACLCLLATGCASQFFYLPNRELIRTPESLGLQAEDVWFASEDGTRLHGWWMPALDQPAKGTIIHFHGNAHNISAYLAYVHWLPKEGYNLFMFDYRGYGESDGSPDRDGVQEDANAALRLVMTRTDIDTTRVALLGQSLGGALAIVACDQVHPRGIRAVIADSAFYSYRSIVRDKIDDFALLRLFKWPLSFLIISNHDSPGHSIANLSPIPVLLIHGTDDRVVPVHHGEWLYEEAGEPKTYWRIEDGRHTDAFLRHQLQCRTALLAFLDAVLKEAS